MRSTRALRVEGDIKGFRKKVIVYQISIHALRVEGDGCPPEKCDKKRRFLSTPSGWRATHGVSGSLAISSIISIHALRVEGDGEFVEVNV